MLWNPIPGIAENLLAEAIVVALVGCGVMAWLSEQRDRFLKPIAWGAGGAIAILAVFALLRVISYPVPEKDDNTTVDNIEARTAQWLDNFSLASQRDTTNTNAIFQRLVTLRDGTQIGIARLKARDRYLIITVRLGPDPEEKRWLDKMTRLERAKLMSGVRIELARSRLAFTTNSDDGMMIVGKSFPINASLTESVLINNIEEINSVVQLVQLTLTEAFSREGLVTSVQ